MSWGGIENALESGEEVPEVPEDQGIFTPITKKPGRGDVEDVQAAVTDPNIADENLDDRLGGIGLKLSLDPGEGVIRVAEIDLGGPCYHPVEVRMRHSQNVAHLVQRRSSVPANTSSISIPVEIVDARQVEIGDIVRAIDGQDVTGLRRNQIARMIVGRLNTPVVVRVAHEERDMGSHTLVEFDMLLKRDRKRAPSPTFFTIHAVGIEIAVCPDFTFEISKVITGSPAWDQGTLAIKDRIWMVNHEYCDHLRIYDVKKLFAASVRGQLGVRITVLRGLRRLEALVTPISEKIINVAQALELPTILSIPSLGASFSTDPVARVISLFHISPDGPCHNTRLLEVGDELVAIDGKDAAELAAHNNNGCMNLERLRSKLDGPEGSFVTLHVRRPGVTLLTNSQLLEQWPRACSLPEEVAVKRSLFRNKYDVLEQEKKQAKHPHLPRPVLLRSIQDAATAHGGVASAYVSLGLVLVLPKGGALTGGRHDIDFDERAWRASLGRGVQIHEVRAASPAAEAGLLVGDVIASLDGQTVLGFEAAELEDMLDGPVGTTCTIGYYRLEGTGSDSLHCITNTVTLIRVANKPPPSGITHGIPTIQTLTPVVVTDARLERLRTMIPHKNKKKE